MRIDLFSDLRRAQLAGLYGLQRRCERTDFTDRDEIYALDEALRNAAGLLSACAALETKHIHPLLAGKALWAFELTRYRHYLGILLRDLETRLGGICEHAQRLNPVWRAALTTEGRIFGRELGSFMAFFSVYLDHQRGAMRAIAAGGNSERIGATHWHIASALSLLTDAGRAAGGPLAAVLPLNLNGRVGRNADGRRRRMPRNTAPLAG